MTSVDDKLFVLLDRRQKQVAVYSISNCQLLRHLDLPDVEPRDMTSCAHNKCLYISDPGNSCIQRFDLSSEVSAIMRWITSRHISKWLIPRSPHGLSIIPGSCNLLVTCRSPTGKLVELSADSGQCVREIRLQAAIKDPHHAVQLTTGQFVLSHGAAYHGIHQVSVVDVEGRVMNSYGGHRGSDVGQLSWPRRLAVDGDSRFIFVADYCNRRVVLLTPTLEFVRYFSDGLSRPRRLYLHQATRRLFVAESHGFVSVIQL